MKAVYYEDFQATIQIKTVPDPTPSADGVVIQVTATGLCRSDWHGWMGHDPDISTPHVPGHELIGKIVATGKDVQKWQIGERVTVPFVGGCEHCEQCQTGNQQVCNAQFQPGFTHWGSFAELVTIKYADTNLVQLPDFLTDVAAASLGCRFVTAFRGLMDQGQLGAGQWVAVHGCGGVGLSAIMIAHAVGANIIAIDIDDKKLQLAKTLGANYLLHGRQVDNIGQAIKGLTGGGAHVSMDALGHPETCVNSVSCLRKRGKHIQVGLLVGDQSTPPIPMNLVVAHELEILGSHGIQAHQYKRILNMIETGKLTPEQLVQDTIHLDQAPTRLMAMDQFNELGITIINQFDT